MASRRDELNAYTFAKRRLVAAFLQPSQTGTEEGAPRPLRAVIPGLVVSALVLAGFGAWGMFKPSEPDKWDEVGEKVIVGDKSTTRYVVLPTGGKEKQLHPVLNLASARLVLKEDKGEVVKVGEDILDSGDIPHGSTIGIPYAPDRLPEADEAAKAKRWAVCQRPGQGGRAVQKAAFVFADRDLPRTEGEERLTDGELLHVSDRSGQEWLIDRAGSKYPLTKGELLRRSLLGGGKPQRVNDEWLATFHEGDEVAFPTVPGVGDQAGAPGELGDANRVGMVLRARAGTDYQYYVVLKGRVAPVSDFTAVLLLSNHAHMSLGQNGRARTVAPGAITPSGAEYLGTREWPEERAVQVNSPNPHTGSRNTVCNVLRKVNRSGATTLSTWAGREFPAQLPTGSTSAYVTPGSGQLFRQVKGNSTDSGSLFLATDTGLRYALQGNYDSTSDDPGVGTGKQEKQEEAQAQAQQEGNAAQVRLGYKGIKPTLVPASWSQFLPTGPRLSTPAARQPQGS